MDAALECVAQFGLEKTSVGDIARVAGVTRPTVYAYFTTRDEILAAAIARAGRLLALRMSERIASLKDPADQLVEAMLIALREFPVEPALMLLVEPAASRLRGMKSLSPAALAAARVVLEPVVARRPSLRAQQDEIAEMMIRMLFSLLTIESPALRSETALRGFLRRRLVPALGL